MFEPFGNTTDLPLTHWHPEPQFRGTFSILSSCLITMSLCIWTSLHLNLPGHGNEHMQKYRKAIWMILGLLAPELVVWNAWEQRKQAESLSAQMVEKEFMPERLSMWNHTRCWITTMWQTLQIFFLLRAKDLPELGQTRSHKPFNGHAHAWTDVHSWFVAMGGMALEDSSPEDQQFMLGACQRLVLTPEGLAWMVTHHPRILPDISREHILDKSKSDSFTKGLTCWQTGYFCILCLFRLSRQLSITLLELNVFAHAICALLVFIIWWQKPRDVQEPVLINDEESLDLCAFWLQYRDELWLNPALEFQCILDTPPLDQCLEISQPAMITVRRMHNHTTSAYDFVIMEGLQSFRFLKVQSTYWRLQAQHYSCDQEIVYTITSREIARLIRAFRVARSRPELSVCRRPCSFTCDRMSNWNAPLFRVLEGPTSWSQFYNSDNIRLVAGATFAGACYGGLHLLAWNNQFPSYTEAVIWRVASVTILVTGPTLALNSAITVLSSMIAPPHSTPDREVVTSIVVTNLVETFTLLLLIWYTLCRAFLVVECFKTLAHIPESALRVPTWAAYIPSFN